MMTMTAITAARGLELGIGQDVKEAALAYLVVVLESRDEDRLDEDIERLGDLIATLGALDVYVLPAGAATELIEARERAFFAAKAAGANEIIDTVVPARADPRVSGTGVNNCAGQRVDDSRMRSRRRRQRASLGVPARRRSVSTMCCAASSPPVPRSVALSPVSTASAPTSAVTSLRSRTPRNWRSWAHQSCVRSGRHPQSRAIFEPARAAASGPRGDRRRGGPSQPRCLGCGRCVRQPRHIGDAFRRDARRRAGDARCARALRRCRDRCGRRLRAHARHACRSAAPPRPGLGNGIANLHNARRSHAPVVVIVGDHATYHAQFDAPLQSDIETVARNVSSWIRRSARTEEAGADAAAAVAAAYGPPGQVATLILPADVSWSEGGVVAPPAARRHAPRCPRRHHRGGCARASLGRQRSAAPRRQSDARTRRSRAAARIAAATGAELLAETFAARAERGAGIPEIQRLAYLGEMAAGQLEGLRHLILVDARSPVSFFAYPGKPSDLVPEGCDVTLLAGDGDDVIAALDALAGGRRRRRPRGHRHPEPDRPSGALGADSVALAIGALLPEGAIVSDEAAHERNLPAGVHGGSAAARLALAHRRVDRPGASGRGRSRRRLPGPAGPRARG